MNVRIVFCKPCGYTDRATSLANEILKLYGLNGVKVTLEAGTNGIFDVYFDEEMVFSRYKEKRLPENKEILDRLTDKLHVTA
ncbi:hypothetical protein HS7_04400 [Sulfolobales archaeon HS-7]|nr:hypothetical protein HS7_04400 [Sulfolobales archaeon HS-7]